MGTWTVPAPPVPDFALSTAMNTYNVPIGIGTPVSYTLTVTPQNGFNSPVHFSMAGMWGCTTPLFSPTDVTGPPWTTTLTMTCYAPDSHNICATVVATGGVQAHQLVLFLNYTSSVQYYLSTTVSPAGSGSISPASGWYPANTLVPLTASANPGYQFKEFSGALPGGYVRMDANKTVTANFTQTVTNYTLTTSVSPPGSGTLAVSPACCTYTAGTPVTITASAASGYQFSGWSGVDSSHDTTGYVTMNGTRSVTANFTAITTQYQLTTSVSPAGTGTISPATGWYNAGAMTITATANSGYTFSNFSGTYSGTTNPLSINLNGNGTIAANFVPGYSVSGQVTLSGSGTGVSGVNVSASGSQSGSSITDASGRYSLPGLAAGGSYTVSASKSGYALSAAQSFTNLAANQTASFTATPWLSINGGSNSAEVAPSTNVSMAFNLYDPNGANDIGWAQFYLADSSGHTYCYGDWGRPSDLFLYDGNTGATHGFGINQSDSFCTVSLTSITNSPTDPTQVMVVLNFNFNPGTDGAYTVLTQINYGSGYAGPWEALGTLTIDLTRQPVTSPPVYQPPPESEPLPPLPPPVSASGNACTDMSAVWSDSNTQANARWSLSQTGGTVSGSLTQVTDAGGVCSSPVTVQWIVSGIASGGSAHLDADSPSPASFQCGNYIIVEPKTISVDLSPSCSSAVVTNWTSTYPPTNPTTTSDGATTTASLSISDPRLAPPQSLQPFTRSGPPGVSVTVDLMNGKINTQLAGQNKTGDLSVAVNNSQGQQMLLTPHSSAKAGDSFSDSFPTLIQAGQQYGSVTVTWDSASVLIPFPVSFFTIGRTHFTQYNTPYYSSCSSSLQPALIINKIDAQYCYYQDVMLGSVFAQAVFQNGTGVWDANGTNTVLKSYDAGSKATPTKIGCPLYPGFDSDHTFFSVDAGGNQITKINGSHWSAVLSDGSGPGTGLDLNNYNPPPGSLATDPTATNNGSLVYRWSDPILLFDQSGNSDSRGLRSVQDLCPACAGQATEQSVSTPAHIDTYNGASHSCSAHSVGDYGNGPYYVIRLR